MSEILKKVLTLLGLKRTMPSSDGDRSISKRLIKNTSLSLVGSVVSVFTATLRMALLTKYLSIADYGKIVIIQNFMTLSGSMLNVSLTTVINRFYIQYVDEGNSLAIRTLLIICFGLSIFIGLVLCVIVVIFAPWISEAFYREPALIPLLRINAVVILVAALYRVSGAILRLDDDFRTLVLHQILSQILMTGYVFIVVMIFNSLDLRLISVSFVLGMIAQTFYPFVKMLRAVKPHLMVKGKLFKQEFINYRILWGTIIQANLASVLSMVFSPGDVFFLGVLGTQEQVALYGLAKNLLRPLEMLQSNIQLAITPEIINLWTVKKYRQLKTLLQRYMMLTAGCSIVVMSVVALLARPAIFLVARPEYLDALPIVYLMLSFFLVSIVFLAYFPLAIVADRLVWLNGFNVVNIVGFGIYMGIHPSLDAVTMAWIVFLAAVNRRMIAHLWVGYLCFKGLRLDSQPPSAP